MPDAKYKVFDEGGLNALVNQTKANKNAAAENSAAVDGLTGDFQGLTEQMTNVLGEVEDCLNQLDEVKADTDAVNEALGKKSDVGHTHSYNDLGDKPTIPTKTSQLTNDSGFKTTDNNTTYTLTKSGSTITLTGSDGKTTSVTDADTDTVYTHPSTHPASMITGLAKVATSGSYNDLSNKPTIPAAYTLPAAGSSLGGVKSGGDVTISSGVITVNNAATATKATQDASGNTITSTYATKTELNSVSIDCGTF